MKSRAMSPFLPGPPGPTPCPDKLPLIPVQPWLSWSSDRPKPQELLWLTSPSRATPKGEGEVKAAQLIALASRVLLMNQPPQKPAATSDFMKRSRWEDLERSYSFIELNILESSPRLNRD